MTSTKNLAVSLKKGHTAPFDGDLIPEWELKNIMKSDTSCQIAFANRHPEITHYFLWFAAGVLAGAAYEGHVK